MIGDAFLLQRLLQRCRSAFGQLHLSETAVLGFQHDMGVSELRSSLLLIQSGTLSARLGPNVHLAWSLTSTTSFQTVPGGCRFFVEVDLVSPVSFLLIFVVRRDMLMLSNLILPVLSSLIIEHHVDGNDSWHFAYRHNCRWCLYYLFQLYMSLEGHWHIWRTNDHSMKRSSRQGFHYTLRHL